MWNQSDIHIGLSLVRLGYRTVIRLGDFSENGELMVNEIRITVGRVRRVC